MFSQKFNHWQITQDLDNIIWLYFDHAQKRVNILDIEALQEFARIAQILQDNANNITGLILLNAKPTGFIYGADIHEFEKFPTEANVHKHLQSVHQTFAKIANLPCPTAVGIDGLALGGGLEIALLFDQIIAINNTKTQLAFPEIKLGLIPAYGGTGRTLARINHFHLLRMVLSGRQVGSEEAFDIGLVDLLVADHNALKDALKNTISMGKKRKNSSQESSSQSTPENMQAIMADARLVIEAKYRPDHNPAAFALLEHFTQHGFDHNALIADELTIFPTLLMGKISKNKRRIFALTDRIKKQTKQDPKINNVHVVGAGVMGGDIAAIAALAGFHVSLQDLNPNTILLAQKRAQEIFARKLPTPEKITEAQNRLISDPKGGAIANADIVIEAVAESLTIKQQVFTELAQKVKPSTLLASNTSAIPLEKIAENLPNPQNFMGLHFFNPVPVLPLVEIITIQASANESIQRALAFIGALGKLPILCKSVPGFLVNRALFPYIFASIEAVLNGESADKIDQALLDFGMKMGPIELADQIGLDVCFDISTSLGAPNNVRLALQAKIASGAIGRKTGTGFYSWNANKAVRPRKTYQSTAMQNLAQDLLSPLIDKCHSAVTTQIVADADLVDAAMIFGIGFPEHTGGPLHWKNSQFL